MRLVQVSDCHLSAEPGADYRGQDPDVNLERLLAAVRAFEPDRLILTGDLSEDASPASYERVRDWALAVGCSVAWLPGNHDDRAVMAPVFDDAGFEAGPVIRDRGWQLVLLDSAWPGRPEGELDEERLQPLAELDPGRPTGIFVHHQPVPVGAPWIDKVPLVAPERLWDRVDQLPGTVFVAFGHVHQRFRERRGAIECLAAPSTAANSEAGSERFSADPGGPLARWFELAADGRMRSGCLSTT